MRSPFSLTFAALACLIGSGCSTTVRETTEVRPAPAGIESMRTTTQIDGRTVDRLTKEWEKEYIEAVGNGPYVDKYPGQTARNKLLALEAARADAKARLLEQVTATKVTSSVTVADLSASTLVQTQVRGYVQDAETVSERYIDSDQRYEVRLRMAKLVLLKIVRESVR